MSRYILTIIILASIQLACAVQGQVPPANTLPNREYSRSMSTDDFYLRRVIGHGVLQIDAKKPRETKGTE